MTGVATTLICILLFLFLTLAFILASAIRVVPEYQRLVVFRLGRAYSTKGPGLVLLIPIVDRGIKVDLREQKREVPHQIMVTRENVPVSINYDWYFKVIDPMQSILQVGNFELAAAGMGVTALRAIVGGLALAEALSQREQLARDLHSKLDEVTGRWGVKVTNVEIRDIIPPKEIQEAVNQQINDERIHNVLDPSLVSAAGETQTLVHLNGKVTVAGRTWDAVSPAPILPSVKIRVRRVILEVEKY